MADSTYPSFDRSERRHSMEALFPQKLADLAGIPSQPREDSHRAPEGVWWGEHSSESAFEAFVLAHRRRVHGLLIAHLGRLEEAEDLTQEVFLRVWRARQQWSPGREPWPWLAAIALNVARDVGRRRGRRPLEISDEERLHAERGDRPDPRHCAEQRENLANVRRAISELPERQREVLILSAQAGLTHGEIAEAMEIRVGAVRVALHRARKALRPLLEQIHE